MFLRGDNMATMIDIEKGDCFTYKDKLYQILEYKENDIYICSTETGRTVVFTGSFLKKRAIFRDDKFIISNSF